MTTYVLEELTDEQLIDLFREITEQQYYADQMDHSRKYNALYKDMVHVVSELKRRPGDRRRLLVSHLSSRNPQVRLMSAAATLTLEPAARDALEKLRKSGEYPQAANAGMFAESFDEGRWPGLPPEKPV